MKQELLLQRRGRPLMLGSLDQMVQRYLRAYRTRGGPVNSLIAVLIAKVLIARKSSAEFVPYRPRFVILRKKLFPKNGVYAKNENNW